jgi:type IV pilus assembly protein PilM
MSNLAAISYRKSLYLMGYMESKSVFKIFQSRQRSILGIDINASSVRIVELDGSTAGFFVKNSGCELLPPHVFADQVLKDIDAVTYSINQLFSKKKFISKQVALAVPDSTVISKIIQIKKGFTQIEIEELVLVRASQYLPHPIEDIFLDFEILGPSENPSLMDVLILASTTENIKSRVEAVHRVGLTAIFVDVESYALNRAEEYLAKSALSFNLVSELDPSALMLACGLALRGRI